MKQIFKRTLLLLALLIGAVSLVACNNGPKPSESVPTVPSTGETVVDYGALIDEDMAQINELEVRNLEITLLNKGMINDSEITWKSNSKNISNSGVVIPYNFASSSPTAEMTATFKLGGVTKTKTFTVTLPTNEFTEIDYVKEVSFTNLTDEYKVLDTTFNIYQNSHGSVPYVSVVEWIELLRGLISEDIEFDINIENGILTIEYLYEDDEDGDEVLTFEANSNENTIETNDFGFFYGYVESTETNYSRNIFYDRASELNHYVEGNGLSLDLGKYSMQVIAYEDDILIPYYVANLLFANTNYYSVYYNQENMHGVYYIPDDSQEIRAIQKSNVNNTGIPADLLVHNFNFMALFFDNLFGLKEYQEVDTYYSLLFNHTNDLLSSNAKNFDESLFSFINKEIDEQHTYYGQTSYYQRLGAKGPSAESLGDFGQSYRKFYYGLLDIDTEIGKKFGRVGITSNQWAANSTSRPNYWFVDDGLLVVILDGFLTADLEESEIYDEEIVKKITDQETSPIPEVLEGDRFIYYNSKKNDTLFMELLAKGVSEAYLDTYITSLLANGFIAEIDGAHIYLTKEANETLFEVNVLYDNDFEVFYLSVVVDRKENISLSVFEPKLKDLIKSDSAIYLELQIEKALREKPTVTKAILDISWNMGGNVGALYRVIGLLFNESFKVSNTSPMFNSKSTNVISINPPVSFENLDWFILTSSVSFSAANMMPTIVKYNSLAPIIGQPSSGGAASVTPVYLPVGSIFASSSSSVSAYVEGDNTEGSPYVYTINEGGIQPDFLIPISLTYNNEALRTAVDF